jgi:hypothetical protein
VHGTEPSGPAALGEHALYHWYRGGCGEHLFLAASLAEGGDKAGRAALEKALASLASKGGTGPPSPLPTDEAALKGHLAACFAAHPVDAAVAALAAAGVVGQRRFTMAQRRDENVVNSATAFSLPLAQPTFLFARDPSHPIGGAVTIFSPCAVRPTRCAVQASGPAPQFGAHSAEVLTGTLGFSQGEVKAMVAGGAVAEQWSESYLPGGDPWAKQAAEYHAYVSQADGMGAGKCAPKGPGTNSTEKAPATVAAPAAAAPAVAVAATHARCGEGGAEPARGGLPAWVLPFAAGAALAALVLRK